MFHVVDTRLRDEARRFRLAFACPDCVHFEPEGESCSLGYPAEPHRSTQLEGRDEVIFCKAFELL